MLPFSCLWTPAMAPGGFSVVILYLWKGNRSQLKRAK